MIYIGFATAAWRMGGNWRHLWGRSKRMIPMWFMKKPAQKMSYRKCRAVDIQYFCSIAICAGLFVDHHADLHSGLKLLKSAIRVARLTIHDIDVRNHPDFSDKLDENWRWQSPWTNRDIARVQL